MRFRRSRPVPAGRPRALRGPAAAALSACAVLVLVTGCGPAAGGHLGAASSTPDSVADGMQPQPVGGAAGSASSAATNASSEGATGGQPSAGNVPAAAGGILHSCGSSTEQLSTILGGRVVGLFSEAKVQSIIAHGAIPALYRSARYVGGNMMETVLRDGALQDDCQWQIGDMETIVEVFVNRGKPVTDAQTAIQQLGDMTVGHPLATFPRKISGFDLQYACTDQPTVQAAHGTCVATAIRVAGDQSEQMTAYVFNHANNDIAEMQTDAALFAVAQGALAQL